MSEAAREDLEVANNRFHLVQAYLSGQPKECQNVSRRTLQRWSKKFREATDKYGCGYVGLLPQRKKQGNRNAKTPPAARELLETFITTHFDTPRQAPAASVYRAYKKACIEQNLIPLSHSTFYKRISSNRTPERLTKRYEATIAYNQISWYWELNASTPRHGDRPLSVCHLDHTQLDIELRSSTTGRLLGRPWMTLLTDAYSRRILAVYLTFDPPSYRSCMMALRICVGRTGRFPESLVVDGGKEFHSVYFDSLLARYCGVGKTTMIKRLEKRFNGQTNNASAPCKMPLLVLKVRS